MYELSGHIAELLDDRNRKWNELIQEYYFNALGMPNAGFIHTVPNFDDFAKPGNRTSGGTWEAFDLSFIANVTANTNAAAGAICAGSSDFVPYLAFLLRQNATFLEKINKQAVREAWLPSNYLPDQQLGASYTMFEPRYKIDSISSIYGMGWFVGVYRGKT